MTIRAIVFDMDGVLIDAKEWHYEALNRALELFGYTITRSDHLKTYDGLPTRRKLELLSKDRGLPVELHGFINEMKQRYTIDMVHTRCRPRFVHQYALAKLKSEGYLLALASNSVQDSVSLMMEKANLQRYLDLQLSATDVSQPKPDPEIYHVVMKKLGVKPNEVLIVEDNDHGIKAAVASGAHVLRVNTVEEVNYDNISRRARQAEKET